MKRTLNPSSILIVLLAATAGTSLLGVLDGRSVYFAAAAGAAVAGVTAEVGKRLRLLTAEWVALSIVVLVACGGFVAAEGLTPDYPHFFNSLIDSWADLLSSVPPVRADRTFRILPYALAWLAGAGGFVLATHVRIPASASVAPLAVFGIGLLFSVELRATALAQGALLAVLSLALGWFQQRELGLETDQSIGATTVRRKRTRVAQAGGVLLAVAIAAPLAAPHAPGFDSRERFDLRDRLEPPWNPLNEASPLAQVKGYYLDQARDEVVFVARGENIPQRWRLASLGVFNGTVWTVGDTYVQGDAPFVPVDKALPLDPQRAASEIAADASSPMIEVEVEVTALDAPWLPLPDHPVTIEALSDSADLRFNAVTRTAARPAGANGSTYTVGALAPIELSDERLRQATFPLATGLGLSKQAGTVRNWAADLVEGFDRGWLQVEAVRDDLTEGGFYLATDDARPGHSWARLTDFFSNDEVYGFEEQYAAAAAIATRNADLSSRVVVGFLIDQEKLGSSEVAVTGNEMSAWIEVLTNEHGWVAVDVTPDRDNEPTLQQAGIRTETVAAPNPPPPPPPPSEVEIEPEELEIQEDDEEEQDDEETTVGGVGVGPLIAGVLALPLVGVGIWTLVVATLKTRRRSKRERASDPDSRITGAWHEANDRLVEAGSPPLADQSPRERAASIVSATDRLEPMQDLARAVDRSAFGPRGSTPSEADQAWRRYDEISTALADDTSLFERARRTANAEPLRRTKKAELVT